MGLEEIKKALDQLSSFGVKQAFFTGGEPFILPYFEEVLKHAKSLGFRVEVVTNGTQLTDEKKIKRVLPLIDSLMLSVDGTQKVHDKVRGVVGTYDKAMDFVKKALRLREEGYFSTEIFSSSVMLRDSLKDTRKMIENMKKQGLDFCRLQPLIPYSEKKHKSWTKKEKELLENLLSDVATNDSKDYYDYIRMSIDRAERPFNFCFVPHLTIFIDYNGNVYPCCFLSGKENYVMGNIKNEAFTKIWKRRRYKKLRKNLLNKLVFPTCVKCVTLQDLNANKLLNEALDG